MTILVAVFIVWSRSNGTTLHGGNPDGSWMVTLIPTSGPPGILLPASFKALITMTEDGRLMETDLSPFSLPQLSTTGHGEWTKISNREFGLTYVKLLSDETGIFRGTVKVRETIQLSLAEDEYTGEGDLEFLDPDGNVTLSFSTKTQAKRIEVELRE